MKNEIHRKGCGHFSLKWFQRPIIMVWISLILIFPSVSQAKDGGIESLRQTSKAFSDVAKKVSPAVVFIQVEKTVQQPDVQFFHPSDQVARSVMTFLDVFLACQGRKARNSPINLTGNELSGRVQASLSPKMDSS